MNVLIIGGGITGLLIGQGLKKNGISCTVFEKATQERSREWAVTLHWSMQLVLSLLPPHLAARLNEAHTNPWEVVPADREEIVCINGASGQNIWSIPFPGAREVNVKKMRKLLSEDIDVKTGKELSTISAPDRGDYVEAIFTDGTKIRGTTLVGADGGGSVVRRVVTGSATNCKVQQLPYEMVNISATYPSGFAQELKEQLHPIIHLGIHPRGRYCRVNNLDIADLNSPETWKFQILATWPQDSGNDESKNTDYQLENLRAEFAGWCDPFKAAVMNLSPGTPLHVDKVKQWKPGPWNNFGGRVTLAGDAAHASTFHRGQGMNNAVVDASKYVHALTSLNRGESTSLGDVISRYDTEVISRGAKEVEVSQAQTERTHEFDKFVAAATDAMPSSASALE